MQDLFDVVTIPLKKIVALLFSLEIGNTNIGSLVIIGSIMVVLISAVTHCVVGSPLPLIGSLRNNSKTVNAKDFTRNNTRSKTYADYGIDKNSATYNAWINATGIDFRL